jgi:uncharacterized lipoprotein YehR (DUF1307 family)
MGAIMMKILTHRILIVVVCLSVLFLGCIEEENHKTELSIDTPEEAIEYAKTDNCTREWIEAWSELGCDIKEDASVVSTSKCQIIRCIDSIFVYIIGLTRH